MTTTSLAIASSYAELEIPTNTCPCGSEYLHGWIRGMSTSPGSAHAPYKQEWFRAKGYPPQSEFSRHLLSLVLGQEQMSLYDSGLLQTGSAGNRPVEQADQSLVSGELKQGSWWSWKIQTQVLRDKVL